MKHSSTCPRRKGTEETEIQKLEFLEMQGELGWITMMTYPELAYEYAYSKLESHVTHPTQMPHDALRYEMGYRMR